MLRAFRIRWQLPDGGEVDLDFDPVAGTADSGILDADLAALLVELGEVAAADRRGVLFTIDEVQYLSKDNLGALIIGLHRVSQEQLPFLVAGGGLPSLPGLAGEAKSYAARLFDFRVIDSLSEEESALALREPAEAEGVAWDQAAIDRVLELTEGYPYFLQEFGKQAWDVATGPERIARADVDAAVPIALAELDAGFFRVRVDRTPDAERAYLRAMAALGPGPHASGEVAAALGRTTTQVGPTRDSLIKRGLCYSPRWGQIGFTVPMFDQYVRRSLGR